MIKIQITLNDKKAKRDLNRLNEFELMEQDKDAIEYLALEFKRFLKHKLEPITYTNEDCGLKITWCK